MSVRKPAPMLSRAHVARRLRVLLGTWKVSGQYVGGDEPLAERGTVTFRWLEKDALLVMRSRLKVAPRSISIIGADDTTKAFTLLYSDERPVVRRYEMALTARQWSLDRRQRGFHQRSLGRISADRRTIRVRWETSSDGRRWVRDFDLVYRRIK